MHCRPVPDADVDDKDDTSAEVSGEGAEEDAPKAKKKTGRRRAAPEEEYRPEPRRALPNWIRDEVSPCPVRQHLRFSSS